MVRYGLDSYPYKSLDRSGDTQPPQLFFSVALHGPILFPISGACGASCHGLQMASSSSSSRRLSKGADRGWISLGIGLQLDFLGSEISNVREPKVVAYFHIYSIDFLIFSMFPSEPWKMTEAGLNSLPHLFPHWNDASMREPQQQTTCCHWNHLKATTSEFGSNGLQPWPPSECRGH